jgi:hypothetical protein
MFSFDPSKGMDILIICVSNPHQVEFWQTRLNALKPYLTKAQSHILVVLEDWPGGAGNGLGTLYAYQQAVKKAEAIGVDLNALLKKGASAAIYHTAGSGQRLSPLSCSELNDKSAVKLSGLIGSEKDPEIISLLEAVIRQTSVYAGERGGRLSVFWGDQIFIPTVKESRIPFHVDILGKFKLHPSLSIWKAQHLEQYGLIARTEDGLYHHIDKIDFETLKQIEHESARGNIIDLGISLGSFSLSFELLNALLNEFAPELSQKTGKLDSDPHFWMATTLPEKTYVKLMTHKNFDKDQALAHYKRMQKFLAAFMRKHPDKPFFGGVDIGKDCYWWDYGTTQAYFANTLKLLQHSPEAESMRDFFALKIPLSEDGSYVIGSHIKKGKIKNSILIGVHAADVNVEDSVIINCTARSLKARKSLLYNIREEQQLDISPKGLIADAYLPGRKEHLRLMTSLERDGKEDWKIKLPGNPYSYEELYKMNTEIDKKTVEQFFNKKQHEIVAGFKRA